MEQVLLEPVDVRYGSDLPPAIRCKPTSRVGAQIARCFTLLGLGLIWFGTTRFLASESPSRTVATSALGVWKDTLGDVPGHGFTVPNKAPWFYVGELVALVVAAFVATVICCWVLYSAGILPWGIDDLIRLDVVDRLRHVHEHRIMRAG